VPAPAASGLGPAIDPTVENGGDINSISQRLPRHELRQGRLDVESAGFGVA
jgi:hypothetical protein